MAAPTNTFTSYSMVGIKENVDEKIYNMSPEETPFVSSLSSEQSDNRLTQWQEDSYASASANNAAIEGDEFSGGALTATFMLANVHQTVRKDIVTSGVANAVAKYGRGKGGESEQDYQLSKKVIECRRDVEASMLSANAAVVGNNATAAKMAGIELFATSVPSHGVGGSTAALVAATAPAAAPADGTTRAFTETILTTAFQGMWNAGGRPKVCFLTMTQKGALNAFAGIATRRVDVERKGMASIIGAVDVYVWETGAVAFVPVYNDTLRNRTIIITDGKSVKRSYIRPIGRYKIAKTGDSTKTMVLTDASLKVTDRRGLLKIADLT